MRSSRRINPKDGNANVATESDGKRSEGKYENFMLITRDLVDYPRAEIVWRQIAAPRTTPA